MESSFVIVPIVVMPICGSTKLWMLSLSTQLIPVINSSLSVLMSRSVFPFGLPVRMIW